MTDAGNEKTAATVMLGAGLPAKELSERRVYILFLLSAAILFAPFFLQGAVLLSNTDNLFNHYPNLIFGHRTLRSGDLGLWNPFHKSHFRTPNSPFRRPRVVEPFPLRGCGLLSSTAPPYAESDQLDSPAGSRVIPATGNYHQDNDRDFIGGFHLVIDC